MQIQQQQQQQRRHVRAAAVVSRNRVAGVNCSRQDSISYVLCTALVLSRFADLPAVPASALTHSPCCCCCCPPTTANKQSLEVDWRHMHTMEAMRPVAAACADAPRKVLRLFDQAAAEQVLASYPQFESIHRSVHVRVTGLPVDDSIRDLRWVGMELSSIDRVWLQQWTASSSA
jgi:hypothetical protein